MGVRFMKNNDILFGNKLELNNNDYIQAEYFY